ncbi:MAG: RtcB family protein [Proteobacteria bacterium]|nr:RtcB family protein [Pseudomonadota bacterium]
MKTNAVLYVHEAMSVERSALEQMRDAASIDPEAVVIATPDIHTGYGVPIGSVLASQEFVSPAAVGYDINCGMRLLRTPFSCDEFPVTKVADAIRTELPLGEGKKNRLLHLGLASLNRVLETGVSGLLTAAKQNKQLGSVLDLDMIAADLGRIEDRGSLDGRPGAVSDRAKERGASQLGTLGGGNHFVEIQQVESIRNKRAADALGLWKDQAVVMIHSGSRGLGHQVAGDSMQTATRVAKKLGLFVPNKQLAYVPADTKEGRNYMGAMAAAANFAFSNRQAIAALVRRAVKREMGPTALLSTVYDVSHNIAKTERHQSRKLHVHRKGATRAFPASLMQGTEFGRIGQPVLIPGSMGTASYVLIGTESAAKALYSVNHGAGRVMSRTAAAGKNRRRSGKAAKPGLISDKRFQESMRGVYLLCENPRTIKEEAPDAYKDIDLVVETVVGAGLAEIVARLVPLAVLKG